MDMMILSMENNVNVKSLSISTWCCLGVLLRMSMSMIIFAQEP